MEVQLQKLTTQTAAAVLQEVSDSTMIAAELEKEKEEDLEAREEAAAAYAAAPAAPPPPLPPEVPAAPPPPAPLYIAYTQDRHRLWTSGLEESNAG
jgi:hypothetical protein